VKSFFATLIIGFIAGLVISGILADVFSYAGKSLNRINVARIISKAERSFADERFSDAVSLYEKALAKINPDNKILYAKTKNNLALSIYKKAEIEKDDVGFAKALDLFLQAQAVYAHTDNKKLSEETDKNIQAARQMVEKK